MYVYTYIHRIHVVTLRCIIYVYIAGDWEILSRRILSIFLVTFSSPVIRFVRVLFSRQDKRNIFFFLFLSNQRQDFHFFKSSHAFCIRDLFLSFVSPSFQFLLGLFLRYIHFFPLFFSSLPFQPSKFPASINGLA